MHPFFSALFYIWLSRPPYQGSLMPAARILVIEDSASMASLYLNYLQGAGFEADVAGEGQLGLGMLAKRPYQAVVLDLHLPVVDGWQVLADLKAAAGTSGIPIIVASAVDERQRGLALGADAYLVKPVSRDELIDALRDVGVPS